MTTTNPWVFQEFGLVKIPHSAAVSEYCNFPLAKQGGVWMTTKLQSFTFFQMIPLNCDARGAFDEIVGVETMNP